MIVKEVTNGWQICVENFTLEIITVGIKSGTWSVLPKGISEVYNDLDSKQVLELSSALQESKLSQKLFNVLVKNGTAVETKRFNKILLDIFKDPSHVRLQKIRFDYTVRIHPATISTLLKYHHESVTELDIAECKINYTKDLWPLINSSPCLRFLCVNYLHGALKCPSLRSLWIVNLKYPAGIFYPLYLDSCLSHVIKNLEDLDLSGTGCAAFKSLKNASNLKTLGLYNCRVQNMMKAVLGLKQLRVLCISVNPSKRKQYGIYSNPEETLARIIQSLGNLTLLRFSGTNLTTKRESVDEISVIVRCDIPALASRKKNPLQFLGLYEREDNIAVRYLLPALKETGSEKELMEMLESNLNQQPQPQPNFFLSGALCTLLKSNTETLKCYEMERRLEFLFQIIEKKRNGWAGDAGLTLQCLNQILEKCKCNGLIIDLELAKQVIHAIYTAILLNPNWPMVILVAYDLLMKIETYKNEAIAHNFENYAKALMSVRLEDYSIDWSTRALLVSLQGMLTCSEKAEHAEFLCGWRIIERDIKHLEYYEKMESTGKGFFSPESIVTVLWRSMSNVMSKCHNAVTRFINNSGIQLLGDFLPWCFGNPELQKVMNGIVKIIENYPEYCEFPKNSKHDTFGKAVFGMNESLRDTFSERVKKRNLKCLATIQRKLAKYHF